MKFRLARRTNFAAPVGLGVALFALAAVLAFVGALASPAGVARAQEATDDGVTGQAGPSLSVSPRNLSIDVGGSGSVSISVTLRAPGTTNGFRATITGSAISFNSNCVGGNPKRMSVRSDSPIPVTIYGCSAATQAYVDVVAVRDGLARGSSQRVFVTVRHPAVTISSSQRSVTEGNRIYFTVRSSAAPRSNTSVKVKVTQKGSFISEIPATSVTILRGRRNASLIVRTSNDRIDEDDGSVTAKLEAGTGYRLGSPKTKTVPVKDNDVPSLTISSSQSSITEGASVIFKVSADIAPHEPLTVNVDVTQKGSFIRLRPTSVPMRSGKTSVSLVVLTLDDGSDELDGSVTATLRTGTGYKLGIPKTKTVPVKDNDSPPPPPPPANRAPTISGPSSVSINYPENGDRDVATFRATDPDGDSITWSLRGTDRGDFNISTGGALTFRNSPDYENPADSGRINVYNVTVRAEDDNGGADDVAVAVTVTNVDEAPTISGYNSLRYQENGTGSITTFTATDPERDAITWSLSRVTRAVDRSKFNISSGGALSFRSSPDFENPQDSGRNNIYNVTVKATAGGRTDELDVAVTVTNVDEGPTISGSNSLRYQENGTGSIITFTATDPERDAVTWSLPRVTRAADRSKFSISTDGKLKFRSSPDYENPRDSGTNNTYKVTVRATAGGKTDDLDVTVTVTNVDEGPTISGSNSLRYQENGTGSIITFTATDPERDAVTWSLPRVTRAADRSKFSISTDGKLKFRSSPDFENPQDSGRNNIYNVTVKATAGGKTDELDVAVTVTDVLEPPTGLSLSVNSTDDDKMDLTYTRSEPPHYYQFKIYRAASNSSLKTANVSASPASFDGLTKGYRYKARGRSCKTASRSVCGAWSGFTSSVLLPVSVSVSANKSAVDEGDDIEFTVTANPAPQSALTVNVKVSDSGVVKYISGTPPKTASLTNSARSATFTVATSDDSDDKANGSVTAAIQAGTGYKAGSPSSTSVIVRDNEPGAPTIDQNVTLGDQRLTVSWTPSQDTGYKPLTGYIVNYRRTTTPRPAWSGLRVGLTPSVIIAGLTNGGEYEARVKACNDSNRSRCGSWSALATGTPRTTPGRVIKNTIKLTGAQNKLTVDWDAPTDGGAAISEYQLIHKKSTDLAWPSNSTLSVIPTPGMTLKTKVDIVGLDDSTSYDVNVRACNVAGCRGWPTAAYAVTGYTALAIPTDLDVIPMALRKAELTWSGDSAAGGYEVQIQKAGDAWARWYPKPTTTASLEIDLDNVTGANGLGDKPYSYELRIKATSGGTYPDSELSEVVEIIDNPILTGGGRATGNVVGGVGRATLKWDSISGVRSYTVRYRKLGDRIRNRPGIGGRRIFDHTDVAWANDPAWPYYLTAVKTPSFTPSGLTRKTISSLHSKEIYAFQLNYLTTGGQKVFSARDAYVWISDGFLSRESDSRVGTYSFFGYWNRGEYDYSVCDDTFTPANHRAEWVNLINHAFEQWQEAAPDLVTVTRKPGSCTTGGEPISNDVPMTMVRALFNESNEVYMVDMDAWPSETEPRCEPTPDGCVRYTPPTLIETNPLFLCITAASACVISPRYWDATWLLDKEPAEAVKPLKDGSVDVLVNADVSGSTAPAIPGGDANVSPNEVKFNTCRSTANPIHSRLHPDSGFENYSLMVHEAGHALGLSNFEHDDPIGFQVAHPSIPDAVMNYDWEVPQIAIKREPDCSPHPFDIMALEALYQTRP